MRAPRVSCCLIIGQLVVGAASADVRLPRLIGDHMVLQRDSKVAIWGKADPGEEIRVDFHGKHVNITAERAGNWSASVGPYPSGGPYDMVVAGKNRTVLRDILLGDVWLASGQSNMEVSVGPAEGGWKGANNADTELAGAHFPQIRLFNVHHRIAPQPVADVEADGWTSVTPTSTRSFSAVAYFFGRELHRRYHIPIGLIDSCWGGTVAEAWMSERALKRFPEFQESIDSLRRIDESTAIPEYQQYLKEKSEWYAQHGNEDRGRVAGVDVWAAPNLVTLDWTTIDEPQTKAEENLKGFDGVVWFRKEIVIPRERAGKNLELHLGYAYRDDTTYFNGTKIGATQGGGEKQKPTDYLVPGQLVKARRNVITVRILGSDGLVGLFSNALSKLEADVGGLVIPLAGEWLHQAGPDLSSLPKPSLYSKLNADPNTPTLLFNGMLAPLTRYKIKGVIWYQGESNASDKRSAQYRTLFPTLISDWRKQWGYEVPFLFVQLAGWPEPPGVEPGESSVAELREAQSMTLSVAATGMATAVDQPDSHPNDKQTVAHRLVLKAATVVYGESIVDSGPEFNSMQIEGSQIRIKFSSLGSGLLVKDEHGSIRGFEIAGTNGEFHPAEARKNGQDIVVFSDGVRQPVAVRYDWMDTPDGNLYNRENLPAIPFRTNVSKPR
jgi:sialate O-acetylesterase